MREPTVHWNGTKALFSMVIGAPPQQYQYVERYWQIYEVTGLGAGDTPVITKVPNQPADYNNVSPIYAPDDRILFTSDRPRNGQRHLYPQLDEYEEAPTVTGIWSLDPATATAPARPRALGRLHAHRRQLRPRHLHALGPPAARPAGRRRRDRRRQLRHLQLRRTSRRAPRALPNRDEVFPEPRPERKDLLAGTNLEGHTFNQFFPWQMNEDGTELETLNHIGRHELHRYFNRSFNDDPNVREFIDATSGRFNPNEIETMLQIKESPVTPGRYFGIDAPEFDTHASGQVVSLPGQPGLPGRPDRGDLPHAPRDRRLHRRGQTPSPNHSGHYRNPLPLSDGTVLVAHTAETRADDNIGTRAAARLALRLPPEAAAGRPGRLSGRRRARSRPASARRSGTGTRTSWSTT